MSSNQGCFSWQWNCCCAGKKGDCEVDAASESQPLNRNVPSIIPVVRSEGTSQTNYSSILEEPQFAYNMNNVQRGTALIFNQMYFSDHAARQGTNKDRDDLEAVLTKLGFEVRIFNNLTTTKIFEELHRVSALKHFDSDCLIVTVMTHGSRDWLYSYDGAYALRDMTILFNDENCPSLKGKPRLFFIQACRGSKSDAGYSVPGPYNYVRNSIEQTHTDAERRTPTEMAMEIFPEEDEKEYLHNQPAYDDFLIVRSTLINYYSFRNRNTGSWFIQDLCRELSLKGTTCDILNVMNFVNWAVTERESFDPQGDNHKKKITICTTSRLKKVLQFNVKKQSNGVKSKK